VSWLWLVSSRYVGVLKRPSGSGFGCVMGAQQGWAGALPASTLTYPTLVDHGHLASFGQP
jgi:hypothetical protein